MRSSEKLIFRATEIGRANENWKWREKFKLSASSSGKSYKWGVNVNIPTQKWKTTKERFREALDLNYKHPGQSSLWFIHGRLSISGMPKPTAIWHRRLRSLGADISFSWRRTIHILIQVCFSLTLLRSNSPLADEGGFEKKKIRYLLNKNFQRAFFFLFQQADKIQFLRRKKFNSG